MGPELVVRGGADEEKNQYSIGFGTDSEQLAGGADGRTNQF